MIAAAIVNKRGSGVLNDEGFDIVFFFLLLLELVFLVYESNKIESNSFCVDDI